MLPHLPSRFVATSLSTPHRPRSPRDLLATLRAMDSGRSGSTAQESSRMDNSYMGSYSGQAESAERGEEHRQAGEDEPQSATTLRGDGSSTVLGVFYSTSPSDDHPSSSSTASSPRSCSFSSTTGVEPSESAASSANSDADWSESCRIPTSFSTATLRATLDSSDSHPHKSASLPSPPPPPPTSRTRQQHAASEPILSPPARHDPPAPCQVEDERTPHSDRQDRVAFVFPPSLPSGDSATASSTPRFLTPSSLSR